MFIFVCVYTKIQYFTESTISLSTNCFEVYMQTISALQREFHWLNNILSLASEFISSPQGLLEDFFENALPIRFPYDYKSAKLVQTPYVQTLQEIHQHTQPYLEQTLGQVVSSRDIHFARIAEQIILLLSIVPHLQPELLDRFRIKDKDQREVLQFGGVKTTKNFKGFLPTGHTAQFLLAGQHLKRRIIIQHLFSPQHSFATQGILSLGKVPQGEPTLAGQLQISASTLHLLTTGQPFQPQFSADFPATLFTTNKTWEDLILRPLVQRQVDRAKQWVTHYEEVKAAFGGGDMKGYRLMMMGPPGTGKTLTAQLLAKHAHKPLYRINIDRIVDKYVGETNKKLEQVFRQAAHQGWILFFDEGDALFGKRSSGSGSSNERYANQEVNYLLTKMEEYEGMIFLSTNQGGALDAAFKRRFDSRILFREPDESTRVRLWEHFFGKGGLKLSANIVLREFAYAYDYNAAWIEKFHRYCVLQTIAKGDEYIALDELMLYMEQFEER